MSTASNRPGGGAGSDTSAIHDDVAGEINAIAAKAAPVGADIVVVEDSAASYAKKKATLTAIFTELSAPRVEVVSSGGPVQALTASGLDGDTSRFFRVRGMVKAGATLRAVELRINALATNQRSELGYNNGAWANTASTTVYLGNVPGNGYLAIDLCVIAKSGMVRAVSGQCVGCAADGSTNPVAWFPCAEWNETATNITSLALWMPAAAEIADGSWMIVDG
jgi:hypothetical protein